MHIHNSKMFFTGSIVLVNLSLFCVLNTFIVTNGLKLKDLFRVTDVVHESSIIDNISETEENLQVGTENYKFADGPVSVDCLRCLCYRQTNCRPKQCQLINGALGCGYFRLTHAFWEDCKRIGTGWRNCSSDVACASQCVQNYMKSYAKQNNCEEKCEGYARELRGGPNGCNNPFTLPYWESVQRIPGCKGVE